MSDFHLVRCRAFVLHPVAFSPYHIYCDTLNPSYVPTVCITNEQEAYVGVAGPRFHTLLVFSTNNKHTNIHTNQCLAGSGLSPSCVTAKRKESLQKRLDERLEKRGNT